ncbi:MAG: DUF6732 family protein [Paracoccaceae bacterium]
MRFSIFFTTAVSAGAAQADPGHLIEVAGHGHWIALGAIGAAIAAGIWGAVNGKADDEGIEADDDPVEA